MKIPQCLMIFSFLFLIVYVGISIYFFDKWDNSIEVSYFVCIWVGLLSDILYFFFEHPILLFLFGTVGFIIFFRTIVFLVLFFLQSYEFTWVDCLHLLLSTNLLMKYNYILYEVEEEELPL